MEKKIIYNGVPAFSQAPAAVDILEENPLVLIQDMEKRGEKAFTVILPKGKEALAEKIKAEAGKAQLEAACLLAPVEGGFAYTNDSAVRKAAEGEKPLPSGRNQGKQTASILDLAENAGVYLELPDGSIIKKPAGAGLKTLLEEAASQIDIKAVYVGHPKARILTPEACENFIPEKGSYLYLIGKNQCMLDEMVKIAEHYRRETCGRCVFGHEGSAQIQMIFSDIAMKKGKTTDLALLEELCQIMKEQSLCETGQGLAELVLELLAGFREELEAHIGKKTCPAGVCSRFLTYHILPEQCTGCDECTDACEEGAILGRKRFIHVIDNEECVQCGACLEACDEEAIVKAGPVKPRCPKRPIPCKR